VRAAGVAFGYTKASQGEGYTDPDYTRHYEAMGHCGLLRGAYHYFEPEADPVRQARRLLISIGPHQGELPPVIDVERAYRDTRRDCNAMRRAIQRFSDTVEQELGRKPVIYSSRWFWTDQLCDTRELRANPLWLKWYSTTPPTLFGGWDQWLFWQYTDSGTAGRDQIDLSRWHGTREQLHTFATRP
jgi:GH25 family lysozyme M1 (1,4-beta-N-acetylmuramidase)